MKRLYRLVPGFDPSPDSPLNDITMLAAHIAHVPSSFVAFVDEDTVWNKATTMATGGRVPRAGTLSGWVVDTGRLMVVPDCRRDPRFANLSYVTGAPHLVFFGGFPLITPEGFAIGALGLYDTEPHILSSAQIDMLERLAKRVVDHLEMCRKARELTAHHAFFKLSLSLLATVDSQTLHFKELNPAWESVLGWTLDELRSRPLTAFVHPEDLVRTQLEADQAAASGVPVMRFENRYLHKDGHWVWLSWVGVVREGVHYSAAHDISILKQHEQLQSDFVSTVSHELRTPLTSIRGALGLVAGGVGGGLPPEAERLVAIALSNSERLTRLVNDILDVEKIQSDSVTLSVQHVDLWRAASRAISQCVALNASACVELGSRTRDYVWGDPDRVEQVLVNLISNAIKFSPPQSLIRLELSRTESVVRVSVIDQGAGVPIDFRPRIFQRFAQADMSATRRASGTGLGLTISKTLVERMSGQIGFMDGPEGGSIFFFELPAVQTQVREAAENTSVL